MKICNDYDPELCKVQCKIAEYDESNVCHCLERFGEVEWVDETQLDEMDIYGALRALMDGKKITHPLLYAKWLAFEKDINCRFGYTLIRYISEYAIERGYTLDMFDIFAKDWKTVKESTDEKMDIVYGFTYDIYVNSELKGNIKPNEDGSVIIPKEWTSEVGTIQIIEVPIRKGI